MGLFCPFVAHLPPIFSAKETSVLPQVPALAALTPGQAVGVVSSNGT